MTANETTIFQPHFWTEQLGLMPVPLNTKSNEEWVMLNGGKGNFCLHLYEGSSFGETDSDPRGTAWSTNVGHHVSITSQRVEIYQWDTKPSELQRFSTSSIAQNIKPFYQYLESSSPSAQDSVVPHVIRNFRMLRTALPEARQADGMDALKAFLLLLACGVEGQPETTFAHQKWWIPSGAYEVRQSISADDWYALYRNLTKQLPREQLQLHLDLTLRHASGQLFQEAHYEAYRSSQMSFNFGLPPVPIAVNLENKAAGLHFTPPALVRVIVEESLRLINKSAAQLRIFDPACGSAEFLRETLRQLLLQGYKGNIELIGWDISPAACDMARFILQKEIADWGAFDRVRFSVEEGDSLDENRNWPQNVALVAMNPPFIQWRDMNSEHKTATERLLVPRLDSSASRQTGNYDLSHVFLVQAAHCLAKDGVLASVLPVSVLDSKAAAKVRGHLSELMQTHIIARLGSHSLFSNALVDAAFYIGQRQNKTSSHVPPLAFWSDYRSTSSSEGFRELRSSHAQIFGPLIKEQTQEERTGFCFYYQSELGSDAEHWLPRPSQPWKLWQQLNDSQGVSRAGDLFDVEQGIRTGCNKAFILSEMQWTQLPQEEQKYFVPSTLNSSIVSGRILSQEYAFYPYGENSFVEEEELQEKLGQYFSRFLNPNKEVLVKRGRVNPDAWWLLAEGRLSQRLGAAKIISTHFGSSGSFAWDNKGTYKVVQGYGWRPKGTKVLSDLVGLSYLAILNSPLFFKLVSAVSHHVSGGQWDLSKRYVSQVPLPNLFDNSASPDLIEELSKIGRSIHSDGLPTDAFPPQWMEVIARAYGLESKNL